jgi:hypothetical protein
MQSSCDRFPLAFSLLWLWECIDACNASYMRVATYLHSANDQKRARFVLGNNGQFIKNAYT